jgi:hypothetical protein
VHEWKRKIQGRALSKRRKAAILTSTRGGGAKIQGADNLREDEVKIDAVVRSPELRTES